MAGVSETAESVTGRRLGGRLRAALKLLPSPRTTPFTFWYLIVLLATTMVLEYGPPTAVDRLLDASSTDAVNLQQHPLRVLFLSALWLQDMQWIAYAVIFTAVLAPLERRIGTRSTVLVFASGHVLATLATELPVLWAVHFHLLPKVDGHLIDVGVSYGFLAAAGAMLLMLPTPVRWWAFGALNTAIAVLYLGTDPASTGAIVTATGHLLSAYIGMLGWLPWLRRRALVGSLRLPSRRPTAPGGQFITPS